MNSLQKKMLLIIAMILSYAMVFIDESSVGVILPKVQQELSLSNNIVPWLVNSYLLTLAVLLLIGGKLSDIYGRRKIFITGILIFGAASIICASANTAWQLLGGRVIQGMGASLLMPCSAVLIKQNTSENEFGKFFGTILGFANFFYAIGPFIGGMFTEFLSWRYIFWLNIPLSVVTVFFTHIAIPHDEKNIATKFADIKGFVSFVLSISALIFALMQGPELGWSNYWIIGLLIISVPLFWAFIQIELRSKDPLLEVRLFANKHFLAGNLVLFCAAACLTALVFLALWLQISLGYSPAIVGLMLLPAMCTFIFVPTLAGIWRDRVGPRIPMLWGTALILVGIIWIVVTANMQSYPWLVLGLVLFGVGIPLAIPNCYTTVISSVEAKYMGVASGTLSTVRETALSVGIAIMTAVIASYNAFHLNRVLKTSDQYAGITMHQVNLLLSGKNTLPSSINSSTLSAIKETAGLIYTHAFASAMAAMGVLALIAYCVTFKLIQKSNSSNLG